MAHFYGGVHGHRGEATRLGTKASGLTAFAQGWDIGVRVELNQDRDGADYVRVYLNKGSHSSDGICLGVFQRDGDGFKQVGGSLDMATIHALYAEVTA